MAEEVEDLVIRAKPEGIEETSEGINRMDEELNESAESMGDTADGMEDIQEAWQGAMGALVAGLVTASAGLLSQVPIIGEAFSGFASVVQSVAYQMDQVLRPALTPIVNGLYTLSSAIFNADGVLGKIVGTLGTLITLFATIVLPIAKLITMFTSYSSITAVLSAAVSAVVGALTTLVAVVGAVPLAIAAVIAGIVLAVQHFVGWGNVLDAAVNGMKRFGNWLGNIGNWLGQAATDMANYITNLATKAAKWGSNIIKKFANGVKNKTVQVGMAISGVVVKVTSIIRSMIDQAYQWGKDLINELVRGVKAQTDKVGDAMEGIAQTARDRLPGSPAKTGPLSDLDETGPGLVQEFAGGIDANVGQIEQATGNAAQAASPTDPTGFRASRSGQPVINLDGRRVSRQDSRYRADPLSRRNTSG